MWPRVGLFQTKLLRTFVCMLLSMNSFLHSNRPQVQIAGLRAWEVCYLLRFAFFQKVFFFLFSSFWLTYLIIRNCQTAFQNGHLILHSLHDGGDSVSPILASPGLCCSLKC